MEPLPEPSLHLRPRLVGVGPAEADPRADPSVPVQVTVEVTVAAAGDVPLALDPLEQQSKRLSEVKSGRDPRQGHVDELTHGTR
jgi:hypothetical protein